MKTWQQARSESGRKGNGWTACGAEHQPTGPAGQEGPRRGGQRGGRHGTADGADDGAAAARRTADEASQRGARRRCC